jgi:chromosome segregation ATPase
MSLENFSGVTMTDEVMNLSSVEFEQQFFAGAEKVRLEIEVLKETCDEIQAAIERNGWEAEEGPRILLTLGLGVAQGRRLIEADDETRAFLAERLTHMESELAVMKFRTFSFMRDNQTLEMRMGALRNSVTGLEGVVQRLRPERDAFKEEVMQLRANLAACRERLAQFESGQSEPASSAHTDLISRFKNLLRRD